MLGPLPVRPDSIAQFNDQLVRKEEDIDLVAWVRELFSPLGYEEQLVEHFDNNHLIQKALGKRPDLQRFYLNTYWSMQLLKVQNENKVSTMDYRAFLTPHGTVTEWMSFFKNNVFPAIIHYELPVS